MDEFRGDSIFWSLHVNRKMEPVSIKSQEKAYVRFINTTKRMVELIWINFVGEYMMYRVLCNNEYVDVNTYKTHPWLAVDHNTKERLYIEKAFFYLPKTSKEVLEERYPDIKLPDNYETRSRVYITLPLYSLKYRALLEIRKYMKNSEDVDKLELPELLKDELKRAVKQRNSLSGLQSISI